MKTFKEFITENTDFDKEVWLSQQKYKINPDTTIDIDGDVNLYAMNLTKLPFKFGKVTGDFNCSKNSLITLDGCPKSVGGDFYCNYNKLTTLEGGPTSVGGKFYCSENRLTTLKGSPESVGGIFSCIYNYLTTLKGCPKRVGGMFCCYQNETLTKLDYLPEYLGGGVFASFSEKDIEEAITQQKAKKTLSYDDEMPDVTDIFD